MTDTTLPFLIFAAVAVAIAAVGRVIYDWLFEYRSRIDDRLDSEFGNSPTLGADQTRLFKDLSKLARQADEEEEHSRTADIERVIEQAGMTIRPSQLWLASLAFALAMGVCVGVISRIWWVGLIGCILSIPGPLLFVALKRDQRLNRLRRQLPDAFEMMSRSISAGQTVTRAFRTIADDFESPIADEFAWCFEQQNLGLSQEIALRELARRSGVTELQMLVVALLVQRQSGGSPVEMLNGLAAIVRKRIELQEKIKTLTAEGRTQAAVLLLLPPLLLAIISFLNPDYVAKLWTRPELLAGMLVSELFGVAWIRRILALDF